MHITRSIIPFQTILCLGILAALVLTGCQPAIATMIPPNATVQNTPPVTTECQPIIVRSTTALTVLTLPDGSEIYLGENTQIEVIPGGYCQGITGHQIILVQGQVAIRSLFPGGENIQVTGPQGFLAIVDDTGLIEYDPSSGFFRLRCTNGSCSLDADTVQNPLACGESGSLDQNGTFSMLPIMDPGLLAYFGDWLQSGCLQAATETPLPASMTPDQAATATANCATFHSQFPLTPCPTYQP